MHPFRSGLGIRNTFHVRWYAICASWFLGTLLGAYVLQQTPLTSLMCSVYFPRTTIVGLIVSLLIPFLLSYILLRFFSFYIILPYISFKALLFCCSYGGVMIAFRDAGWLISTLLLFSNLFSVLLLLNFWFRAAAGIRTNLYVFLTPVLIIGCVDYFMISPFTTVLLNY